MLKRPQFSFLVEVSVCSVDLKFSVDCVFSDFHIKVVDLETNSQKLFLEHEAPVLSLAVRPDEKFLVRTQNGLCFTNLLPDGCARKERHHAHVIVVGLF